MLCVSREWECQTRKVMLVQETCIAARSILNFILSLMEGSIRVVEQYLLSNNTS